MNSAEVIVLLADHCIDGVPSGAECCSFCRAITTVDAMRRALETADREASVAHDAIWHESVQGFGNTGFGKLHDSDDPSSASSAIWRVHEAIRPLLVQMPPAGGAS